MKKLSQIFPKCPDCASTNVFYNYKIKEYKCLNCGRKWSKEKPEEKIPELEKSYLIRDETMMEVETEEGVTLERPLETPEEVER